MKIAVLAAAATQPVTLAELKGHIDIQDDDWNDTLEIYLAAAIKFAANRTALRLAPQSFQLRLDTWPTGDGCSGAFEIVIADGPVRDVVAVTYVDTAGVEQTVSEDQWTWERREDDAVITFAAGFAAPALKDGRRGVVRVEYEAGFDDPHTTGTGDDPDLVLPATVRLAVLMLAAHYFDNREAISGRPVYPVLLSAEAMLDQVRAYR